jgi:hypothetical protein
MSMGTKRGAPWRTTPVRLSELPAEIADAIETGRMSPAYSHLNHLLKDQK